MAAINFGYTISKPRAIDIDRNNLRKSDEILREMPELQACIGCGACTAVCTAGNLTEFNFRKVHTLVRRGEYQGAYEEMNKCMLCGRPAGRAAGRETSAMPGWSSRMPPSPGSGILFPEFAGGSGSSRGNWRRGSGRSANFPGEAICILS